MIVTQGRVQGSRGNTQAEPSQSHQHSKIKLGLPIRLVTRFYPLRDSEPFWVCFLCCKLLSSQGALRNNSCHIFGSVVEAPGNTVFYNLAVTANIYTEHFINNETSISFVPLLDNLRP